MHYKLSVKQVELWLIMLHHNGRSHFANTDSSQVNSAFLELIGTKVADFYANGIRKLVVYKKKMCQFEDWLFWLITQIKEQSLGVYSLD